MCIDLNMVRYFNGLSLIVGNIRVLDLKLSANAAIRKATRFAYNKGKEYIYKYNKLKIIKKRQYGFWSNMSFS